MKWINKYLFVYKTQIIRSFTYKYDVYGNIIMQTIIMITSAFFWRALYGFDVSNPTSDVMVNGVRLEDMLTYIIMSSVLSVLLSTNVERRIESSVRNGSISTDIMKPLNIFGIYLSEDLGRITALIFQNILPILVIGSIFIKVPVMSDLTQLPRFCISMLLSFGINWLLAALFGMWAFTAIDVDALIQVKKHLLRLLSGSIIPLWFFPDWFANILKALPFAYIYQLPLDIYIGKSSDAEVVRMMTIQAIWLVVLGLAFFIVSRRATRKIMIQGG